VGLLPISSDQFEMLLDGNTCDSSEFYRDFEVERVPFSGETLSYLRQRA
jgi:NADH dehydrogenase